MQVREEIGFGEVALGLAVALFFAFASVSSVVSGLLVERLGSHRSMRLAAVGAPPSLLGVAVFARSWSLLVGCLVVGGVRQRRRPPGDASLVSAGDTGGSSRILVRDQTSRHTDRHSSRGDSRYPSWP